MNSQLALLGLESWKPFATALLLPPVPLLLAIVFGAAALRRRPLVGWSMVWVGVAAIWLSACTGVARWLEDRLLEIPPALSTARIAELQRAAGASPAGQRIAVVVLGGGRERFAPEYGEPNLEWASLERLRYGIHLARSVGSPLGFSGGVGWGQSGGAAEAAIAARIADREFLMPLRWIDDASRDTRENASRTVRLLEADGVERLLLVTHGWHMPRARRAFEAAAAGRLRIEAAPMGLAPVTEGGLLDWLPSSKGATRSRQAIREAIGAASGA